MGNASEKAQRDQARFNARMARRQAGRTMDEITWQAERLAEHGEYQLGYGVAAVGKTGGLAFTHAQTPETGVDVGSVDTPELEQLRRREQNLVRELEKMTGKEVGDDIGGIMDKGREEGIDDWDEFVRQMQTLFLKKGRELDRVRHEIEVMQRAGDTPEVGGPSSLTFAAGSDLLSMVHTRDLIERDRRKLIRTGQQQASDMFESAEHFDQQAAYAHQAANWAMFETILGTTARVAGMIPGFL